jgi:hypothetical protein
MPIDAIAFLSSAAMVARKAETYPPETYVVDLNDIRKIIQDIQQEAERDRL